MEDVKEIRIQSSGPDPDASEIVANAERMLGIKDLAITMTTVYRVEGITDTEAVTLARAYHDPITEVVSVGDRSDWENPNVVEVSPKPGTMVPEEDDMVTMAGLFGITPKASSMSYQYEFGDSVSPEDQVRVVNGLLKNDTIQEVRTSPPRTLIETKSAKGVKPVPITELSAEKLCELSGERGLALSEQDMVAIKDHFKSIGREPSDTEIEGLGGWWSDHCRHNTWSADIRLPSGELKPSFKARVFGETAKYFEETGVLSALVDNSGANIFYDGWAITIKGESHISPSGKEPFAGAGTGVGGDQRDIARTGTGPVKQIAGGNILIFASPKADKSKLPDGMLPPDWVAKRVVDGIADYGNKTGIPTNQGSVHFLRGSGNFEYTAKPCVLVYGVGLTPEADAAKGKPNLGDRLILVGGRTGRDGIHGATASSEEAMADERAAYGGYVQIGNPIVQKTMHDFTYAAAERHLYSASNDLGASGIASGAVEMAEDIGVTIQLGNVPTKYPGLEAWEKFISESQERAVLACSPYDMEELQRLADFFGVEITDIGEFDGTHRLTVYDGNELAVDMGYDFIMNGKPKIVLEADWQPPHIQELLPYNEPLYKSIRAVLSHGSVSSKEHITRQFDQSVQAGNVLPSYGGVHDDAPNDAAIVKPFLDKPYGVVTATGINPRLVSLNPYNGTIWACVESMSNLVAVGGDPEAVAFNENFVWPSPTPRNVGSQDLAVDAVVDFMRAFRRSVISGKDSQSSTFVDDSKGIRIENGPVVAWTTVGKIPDVAKTVSSDIKKPGSTLVLVGEQDLASMGGSVFYDVTAADSVVVPGVDLSKLPATLKSVHKAIVGGSVLAAHDVSEGGIVVAVTEMCFGGDCGATINLESGSGFSFNNQLFNETPGCFVLEVESGTDLFELFGDVPHRVLGVSTSESNLSIRVDGGELLRERVDKLKEVWKAPLTEFYDE